MKKSNKILRVFVILVVGAMHVQAATVELTGGDVADGLELTGGLVGAIYVDQGGASGVPVTLQGYTFQPYPATGVWLNNLNIWSFGVNLYPKWNWVDFPGVDSTDDLALQQMMNSGVAAGPNVEDDLALYIQGLTVGKTYTVDLITSLTGYSDRTLAYSANGGPSDSFAATGTTVYATRLTAVANGAGQIEVHTPGVPGLFSAAIVTYFVPPLGTTLVIR